MQAMDKPSAPTKKDDKLPSSSSSKDSRKKATFNKFMKWLEKKSDADG